MSNWRWLDELTQDLRYGVRGLRRNPGFVAAVALTLGLGIGVNTAIFSLTDAVLFRPLPGIRDADRLVALYTDDRETPRLEYSGVSYPDYLDFLELDDVFAGLAAYVRMTFILTGTDVSQQVVGDFVSGNYFSVLGATPILGRLLEPRDDRPDADRVAVISHRLWQERFGADPRVIGRTLTLNDEALTIVGVAPRDFRGPLIDWYGESGVDVFVPFWHVDPFFGRPAGRALLSDRTWVGPMAIGRLQPAVTFEAARTALITRARLLEVAYPDTNEGRDLMVLPAQRARFWPGRYDANVRLLTLLGASTLLILGVACFNLANLLLSRGIARQREIAVRLAMGAGRLRLARQILVEVLLLSLLGAAMGVSVAFFLTRMLSDFPTPFEVPLYQPLQVDHRTAAFASGLSFLTGLVFGLVPGFWTSRFSLVPALKEGEVGLSSRTRQILGRQALVVGQVAMSIVLLMAAVLFARSLSSLSRIDLGYDPENLLMVRIDARQPAGADPRTLYLRLLDEIRAMPGVVSATIGDAPPLSMLRSSASITPRMPELGTAGPSIVYRRVGPRYFETLALSLLQGREFAVSESDDRTAIIVNQALAQRLWPGQDPLGQYVRIAGEEVERRVIGVASNAAHRDLWELAEPYFYLPLRTMGFEMVVIVRTRPAPQALIGAIRNRIGSFSKQMALVDLRTMQNHLQAHLSRQRLAATVASILSVIAIILVAVGTFGLLSFIVNQNLRDVGIRMALGAAPTQVGLEVVGRALWLTLAGVVGGIGAWVLVRSVIAAELHGVTTGDPLTIGIVAGGMIGAMLLAAYLPARTAANADPMVVLRAE